jgi:hypothetical protein
MIQLRLGLAALILAVSAAPVAAESPAPPAVPAQSPAAVHEILDRMVDRNPSLTSYQARVHVDLRMLNFPFLSPKLDGTSYYKRPNSYEVVFDRVPAYAKGFEKLFNDVADPIAWQKDSNVTYKGAVRVNGYAQPMLELFMTKKIYSDQLADTIAYVDPSSYELVQMNWDYRNGGHIVMRQWYREEGPYSLVSQQHVDISIPHVHAVGDSLYGTYQTNVAVDDSVFKK